jgi:ribosomal protein S12 methylthiotransferase accessory factor
MVRADGVNRALDNPFTPLDDALPRLEDAVSPLVGIVKGAISTTRTPDESGLPNCACALASATRPLGAPTVEFGSGAHPDPRRARAAAIGEALERYAAVFIPYERVRRTTAQALGDTAVHPSRFALFHPTQFATQRFPFVPFTEDTPTTWVEGFDLSDGSTAMLPADLVYLRRPDRSTRQIAYSTSSGLACGPSLPEAILAGLLELVERDAVMLAWKCRLSLPLLDWSEHQGLRATDRSFFEPTRLAYRVLDASCFLDVPVAISVLHGPPGFGAALAVGGAAAARIEEAWLKAVAESFAVYRWLRQEILGGAKPPADAEEIEAFDQHMLFYASEERAALAGFLDASRERRPAADVPPLEGSTPWEQIDAVVGRLARRRLSAYAVDVTSPDVCELGVSVARVIAPELCALDVSHRARFQGGSRLVNGAFEAGLLPAPIDVADLNPLPHPYP